MTTVVPINCEESKGGYKSAHADGANFVFGDAAVRFLPITIDQMSLVYMGCAADGQEVVFPDL